MWSRPDSDRWASSFKSGQNLLLKNFDNVFVHLDKINEEDGKKDGKIDSTDEIRGLMFSDILTPIGSAKRPY